MKVLAEIPARPAPDLRTGTLRRSDLAAFGTLMEKLGDARAVLVSGEALARRRTAVGLATTAVAAGYRVALLECDLVEPGLADALGLAGAPGLHEYLLGAVEPEAILKPVVLAGPGSAIATEPLVCVAAGRPAGDAAALLDSDRFRHVVKSLRDTYAVLVIDGPPPARPDELLAAMAVADATVVAVDGGGGAPPTLPAPVAGLVVET